MIDTDKWITSARVSLDELVKEVKRLREVAYRKDMQVGVRNNEIKRLREGRLDLINEVIRIINNKTGERVDADLHDYIIDRLVNE